VVKLLIRGNAEAVGILDGTTELMLDQTRENGLVAVSNVLLRRRPAIRALPGPPPIEGSDACSLENPGDEVRALERQSMSIARVARVAWSASSWRSTDTSFI
jgi:hypothetical protein